MRSHPAHSKTSENAYVKPRFLANFAGKGVIIGCSHNHKSCLKKTSHNPRTFYTIDSQAKQNPDFVLDVTKDLPLEFNERFQLTVLEGLPRDVYNPIPQSMNNGEKGFKNILSMTAHDGFILIIGCPRLKEHRKSLKDLKYIELYHDYNYGVVLIPKNQQLSIQQILAQIKKLDVDLQNTINRYIPTILSVDQVQEKLNFCKITYDEMLTTSQRYYKDHPNEQPPEENEDENFTWNYKTLGITAATIMVGVGLFAYLSYKNTSLNSELKESPQKLL